MRRALDLIRRRDKVRIVGWLGDGPNRRTCKHDHGLRANQKPPDMWAARRRAKVDPTNPGNRPAGVSHANPCDVCGRHGFHDPACPEVG